MKSSPFYIINPIVGVVMVGGIGILMSSPMMAYSDIFTITLLILACSFLWLVFMLNPLIDTLVMTAANSLEAVEAKTRVSGLKYQGLMLWFLALLIGVRYWSYLYGEYLFLTIVFFITIVAGALLVRTAGILERHLKKREVPKYAKGHRL